MGARINALAKVSERSKSRQNSRPTLPISSSAWPQPIAAVLLFFARIDGDGAAVGELVSVAQEIQQRLPQPHLVGMQRPDRSVTMDRDLVGVLCGQRFDGLDNIVDQRRKSEGFEMKLHPPTWGETSWSKASLVAGRDRIAEDCGSSEGSDGRQSSPVK
jgi:hypothetical protein